MIKTRVVILLLSLQTLAAVNSEYEIGYQSGFGLVEDGFTANRFYFLGQWEYRPRAKKALQALEAAIRFSYEIEKNEGRVDVRSLAYERIKGRTTLKLGIQEIAWGETFGIYIADIVNPRDLRDPLFNELDWIRLPVFAVNVQYLPDPWNFQLIVNPLPFRPLLPDKGDPFALIPDIFSGLPVIKYKDFHGGSLEYGGRMGRTLESGLDLTAFYYRHWNRHPVYELAVVNGATVLRSVERRIQSYGMSFTKARKSVVYRGDFIVHRKQPWIKTRFGRIAALDVVHAILGMDQMQDEGWNWGLQYHLDYWERNILHGASGRVVKSFYRGKQELEIFLFKGLNNRDLWLQPKWSICCDEGWQLSLRADFLYGSTRRANYRDGFLGIFKDKDRLFLWIVKKW